jgi:antitoxin HicB
MIHSRPRAKRKKLPKLSVRFYREESGAEPVRDWLKSLPADEKREVGTDIKTVQFGWPLGMRAGAAEEAAECIMKRNPHKGSDFDDFLKDEGIFDEVQALAVKRVLAHQLERGIKAKRLTKTAMAKRMGTTRAQLDRLLDPNNPSATLASVVKAAYAIGKRVRISLANA